MRNEPSDDREGGEEEARLYGTEYYLLEDGVVRVVMMEVGATQGLAMMGEECFGAG